MLWTAEQLINFIYLYYAEFFLNCTSKHHHLRMTTSVACKTEYVTPPPGQHLTDPTSVVISQDGCEQGQEVTSELNLMEMTEIEYTHLQHLIHSSIDVQAAERDGDGEVELNPSTYTDIKDTHEACPSPHVSSVCQPGTSASLCSAAELNNEPTENQEITMVLYNHPAGSPNKGEKTPARCGEVPDSVLAKVKCAVEVPRDRGNHRRVPRGSRPNPPARACLEKRFNCGPSDLTRQQETQAAVLNIFLSLLHQSTDMSGIALHSPPEKWPKTEQTAAVGHAYEGNPVNPSGPATSQGLGHFSQLTEAKKQPDAIAPKNFSFSYNSDKSTDYRLKSPCIIYTDTVDEHLGVSIENEVVRKPVKRVRMHSTRALQVKDLNTIQGSENQRPLTTKAGSKPGRKPGPPLETHERRERHNSMERDRRRRIRLCCDELNRLVPFCNPETDKATTLQWTTAFLKYIEEVYGDSIKQEFQSTFCGKTGVRLKPSYAEVAVECENSSSL